MHGSFFNNHGVTLQTISGLIPVFGYNVIVKEVNSENLQLVANNNEPIPAAGVMEVYGNQFRQKN
eukprot:1734617-Amphidinium_carterae.1